MVTKTLQQEQFQARLKRVAAGGPNTMGEVYCGVREEQPEPKRGRRARAKSADAAPRKGGGGLLSLVGGLLIGAGAMVAIRYGHFRLLGGADIGMDADLVLLVELVLAGALAIMLRSIFRAHSGAHGLGKLAGVLLMGLFMQQAVAAAPGPFGKLFSPDWVARMQAQAGAQAPLFAGAVFSRTKADAPATRGL